MTPRSVAQIVRTAGRSGAESVVLALANELQELGLSSFVICLEPGPLTRNLNGLGIRHRVIPVKSKYDFFSIWKMRKYLLKKQFDVVHTHGPTAMWIGNLAARLARVPVVLTTFHGLSAIRASETRLYGLYYRMEGLLARHWTDSCIAYSEAVRQDAIRLRKIPGHKVVSIHHGIDPRKFYPLADPARRAELRRRLGLPPDQPLLGAVGRLIPVKGHAELIAALPAIRAGVPAAKLVIAGEGPLRGRLEKLASDLGVREAVVFTGEIRDTNSLYNCFDIFVYPSIEGVFGLVVLEAMACGVPVIASALVGSQELLTDSLNSLLVPPGDRQAIADAAVRLLGDRTLRERLAAAARERVIARFSASLMAQKHLSLYRALMEESDRAQGNEVEPCRRPYCSTRMERK